MQDNSAISPSDAMAVAQLTWTIEKIKVMHMWFDIAPDRSVHTFIIEWKWPLVSPLHCCIIYYYYFAKKRSTKAETMACLSRELVCGTSPILYVHMCLWDRLACEQPNRSARTRATCSSSELFSRQSIKDCRQKHSPFVSSWLRGLTTLMWLHALGWQPGLF